MVDDDATEDSEELKDGETRDDEARVGDGDTVAEDESDFELETTEAAEDEIGLRLDDTAAPEDDTDFELDTGSPVVAEADLSFIC